MGNALDLHLLRSLGPFDAVVSNPPFGRVSTFERPDPPGDDVPWRWTRSDFQYALLEVASRVAPYGVFILPQECCPFRYSGERHFRMEETDLARRFREETSITLEPSCGFDCSVHDGEWRFVSPRVEIATADFSGPPSF